MSEQPSWSEAIVEGSLDWSFLKRDDLYEIAELCAAIAYIDDPAQPRDLADLLRDYDMPHAHADVHAVVGRDGGGTIVAYAWNHISPSNSPLPHVWMEFGVHPAWRYHKIGLRLVEWAIDRARVWYRHIRQAHPGIGPLWAGAAVDESSRVADDLRENGTLAPQRWYFDAHRSLMDSPLPSAPVPSGIELRIFDPEWSEKVRRAHNDAFSTRRGAHDVGEEQWEASLARPDFRPRWSWIAVDTTAETPEVVGYALNSEIHDSETGWREGWTERFGVCPRNRRAGLGRSLLVASMRTFVEQGCTLAGVGVDTDDPSRAERLFGTLGYTFDDRVVLFGRSFSD
ncbi:GNAT family N-acetyltransferase [Brooklawnia cerclae]|uniref:GNAT superfamily N-acetyltransferase n=1 Tax=Brooklawnia cerclae TaxID=349934 RepID=A0ABX0SIE6_9ACTN|nr:GNAT family N-acetyltransferase [Brooklawnia cerclae]NIH56512.1 GNAT superfamily N-acetyltransferase [Brooklawnia cerclae]